MFNELEKMMMSIVDFGEEQTWLDIEELKDPITRFNFRHLYFEAIKKLKQKFKGK